MSEELACPRGGDKSGVFKKQDTAKGCRIVKIGLGVEGKNMLMLRGVTVELVFGMKVMLKGAFGN